LCQPQRGKSTLHWNSFSHAPKEGLAGTTRFRYWTRIDAAFSDLETFLGVELEGVGLPALVFDRIMDRYEADPAYRY